MVYQTFTRTWWKHNPSWPGGREPGAGRKTLWGLYGTENEARKACREYNESHDPGFLSRKMEYQSV